LLAEAAASANRLQKAQQEAVTSTETDSQDTLGSHQKRKRGRPAGKRDMAMEKKPAAALNAVAAMRKAAAAAALTVAAAVAEKDDESTKVAGIETKDVEGSTLAPISIIPAGM
jgi:hypothetical protein